MRKRQPRSWIIVISIICGLLYLSLQYSPQEWMAPEPTVDTRHYPETFMQGVQNTQYNTTGRLHYRLTARELRYYDTDDTSRSEIMEPEVIIESANTGSAWHIRAERGRSTGQSPRVTLEENVRAWSLHEEYGRVDMLTDSIAIDTERQFAHTDKPVTMRSARGVTTAVGLSADLEAGRVELLSEVKGTYEPQ